MTVKFSVDARKRGLKLLIAALTVSVSGCLGLQTGSLPTTDVLPELQVGVSTKDDVRRILGAASGRGAIRFTPELGQAELWAYDYQKVSAKLNLQAALDHKFLMVFFATHLTDPEGRMNIQVGRYVGHLWVSTLEPADLGTLGDS